MQVKLHFLLLLLFFFSVRISFSQKVNQVITKPEKEIVIVTEEKLNKAIQKVSPACVYIPTKELLGGSTTGMSASGVCVSRDGIIMTAGHMTIPNGKYEILFPDGSKVPALGLGKIGKLDAGLLKIIPPGNYPFAELGYSSVLKVGELCFSLSHPGSFPDKNVARIGFISAVKNDLLGDVRTNHILSTCVMEPGDSGGPLFDLEGKVIGTRSFIGLSINENYDVPVDVFRTFWSSLMKSVNYRLAPQADSIALKVKTENRYAVFLSDLEKQIISFEDKYDKYCAEVICEDKTILGTLINPRGLTNSKKMEYSTFVIVKASEIGQKPKVKIGSKLFEAALFYRDDNVDLALLKIDSNPKNAVLIKDIITDTLKNRDIGKILITPKPDGSGYYSVVGTKPFELASYYASGYLGLKLEKKGEFNIIKTIQPETSAAKCGLRVGDTISAINSILIEEPENFVNELKKKKPGEVLLLVRRNNMMMDSITVKLGQRPFVGNNHISEKFSAGRSIRRDGFEEVFIQNIDIMPKECGSPVFDLQGKLMGINIARYSRVSSLAIPGNKIVRFLKEAFSASNFR